MHPVACVSTNTLIKPPYATNVFRARFYCALLQHVAAPIGDHLQVKCTQRNIFKYIYYFYVSGTHFCYRLTKPQGLVWPEGLGKFKKSPCQVLNPQP
jgi:hypothetical protein